ncbi:hypothetical protein DUNSADRAFT_2795 [Dunaliella salina]|uniref:PB1 domain-containing protein n=1 Tax=Dunaliella salina TaxID=3046 RepID=A0ABQ7FVW8_DUNSA|nr:hypothetical protein DUNSADRAFT_2795 [Dunaliella salina]|eukprot:KAF5826533.1 hypothetical protein DUNSADRAFT_2795 [Dunaliella salina]
MDCPSQAVHLCLSKRALGPFRLQWTDKDGDNVTVTSRQDIQTALSELFLAFQKQHGGAHAPRLLQQNGLPPLKLQVVPVEKQSEVPKPPLDELFPRKDAGNEPVYEPEEWLLEFARLFSEVTGLDTHTWVTGMCTRNLCPPIISWVHTCAFSSSDII